MLLLGDPRAIPPETTDETRQPMNHMKTPMKTLKKKLRVKKTNPNGKHWKLEDLYTTILITGARGTGRMSGPPALPRLAIGAGKTKGNQRVIELIDRLEEVVVCLRELEDLKS
jgi:hypothetical protein